MKPTPQLIAEFLAAQNQYCPIEFEDGEFSISEVRTRDTLEDFRSASKFWAEASTPLDFKFGKFDCLFFKLCQPKKGMQRTELCIVDFGDFRSVFKENIGDL